MSAPQGALICVRDPKAEPPRIPLSGTIGEAAAQSGPSFSAAPVERDCQGGSALSGPLLRG